MRRAIDIHEREIDAKALGRARAAAVSTLLAEEKAAKRK